MAVANDERYAVREGVVARAVGDEMVLLDLTAGIYFTLNAVGSVIWRAIGAGEDLNAIVASVVAEFEVDPEFAHADILEFLRAGIDAGLISNP